MSLRTWRDGMHSSDVILSVLLHSLWTCRLVSCGSPLSWSGLLSTYQPWEHAFGRMQVTNSGSFYFRLGHFLFLS